MLNSTMLTDPQMPLSQRALEIAERIRLARRRKHMTQAQVANLLRCSRKRVNSAEQGQTLFSMLEADQLAKAFEVPPGFFFLQESPGN